MLRDITNELGSAIPYDFFTTCVKRNMFSKQTSFMCRCGIKKTTQDWNGIKNMDT